MWLYVISCRNQGRQSAPEQSDVIQKHPEIKKDCISLPPLPSLPKTFLLSSDKRIKGMFEYTENPGHFGKTGEGTCEL